jgi:hypothetical protein
MTTTENLIKAADRILKAVNKLHPVMAMDIPEQEELYLSYHTLNQSLTAYEQEQSQSDKPETEPTPEQIKEVEDFFGIKHPDKPERGEETIVSILHYKKQSCHNNIGIFDTRTYVLYDDAVKACDKYSSLKDARIRELEAENESLMYVAKSFAGVSDADVCPLAEEGKCLPGCGTDTCKYHPNNR